MKQVFNKTIHVTTLDRTAGYVDTSDVYMLQTAGSKSMCSMEHVKTAMCRKKLANV